MGFFQNIVNGYKLMGRDLGSQMMTHKADILTGVSVVGTIGTAVISAKDTARIFRKCQKELAADPCELNLQSRIKYCWKDYIPTALSVIGTSAASIGSNRVSATTISQLGTALATSRTVARKFKEAAADVVGEKKAKQISDQVAEEKIQKLTPQQISDSPHFESPGEQGQLFLESYTGWTFYSTRDKVFLALSQTREEMATDVGHRGYLATFKDFDGKEVGVPFVNYLNRLGFTKNKHPDKFRGSQFNHIGWNKGCQVDGSDDDTIDAQIYPGETPDGQRTCWVIDLMEDPTDMRCGYKQKVIGKTNDFFA